MFDEEETACWEGGEGVRMEEDEMEGESREEEAFEPFIDDSRSLLSSGEDEAEGVGEAEGEGIRGKSRQRDELELARGRFLPFLPSPTLPSRPPLRIYTR